jgi:hypothetical protein
VLLLVLAPRASATAASDYPDATFTHPVRITNRFSPMPAGLELVFKGEVNGRSGKHPHLDVFVVTGLTKVIDGIVTRVIWDRDIDEGKIQESELAFEAQDDAGTVWNMGEYPEEYQDGQLQGAPSTWIVGLGDARPGILMQPHPHPNTPAYLQGASPSIQFKDKAEVYRTNTHLCVPVGCFDHVLITKEWNDYEPQEGLQLKFYAPGLGNINVAPWGGDEQEVLKLVSVKHLGPDALARVNEHARNIDARGIATNPIYSHTSPAT